MDPAEGIMKKCTLCVDRIYNDNIPVEDRVPACVRTCPTNARHFGDLGNPESDVSKMVAARGGFDLMPEQQTKPVNKYLPPRPRRAADDPSISLLAMADAVTPMGFWKWVDKTLEKLG
jgi:Fe-S-cluster-containing dehydrogenase component